MTLTLPLPAPFGASGRTSRPRSFLLTAWLIAASVHLIAITTFRVVQSLVPVAAPRDWSFDIVPVGTAPVPPPMVDVTPHAPASRTASDVRLSDGAIEPVMNADADVTASIGDGLVGDVAASGVQSSGGNDVIVVPRASGADDPSGVLDPGIAEEDPIAVVAPRPEYPEWAIEAGMEGTVHVEAVVDKDGLIRQAHVTVHAGTVLDDAALTAVQRSVWRPAMNRGRPVRVRIDVPIRFSLRDRF